MSDANPFTIHFPVSILLGMSLVAHILNGDWFAALWCAVAGVLLVLHYQAIFERGLYRKILSESLSKAKRGSNAAKMREALENIAEYAKSAACHTEDAHVLSFLDQIANWAKSALAAPPRNCDREECRDFGDSCNIFDREVPDSRRLWGEDYWCEHGKWLLATAAEQKGESDGSK